MNNIQLKKQDRRKRIDRLLNDANLVAGYLTGLSMRVNDVHGIGLGKKFKQMLDDISDIL